MLKFIKAILSKFLGIFKKKPKNKPQLLTRKG